jgi:peroxiredoxin
MSRNLEPGTTIPDVELPDENGVLHRLSELQGSSAMVLHLSRGEHCPRERQHHRELLRFHELCSVAFTELVSVLPNDLHDTLKLKISTGARWTFLSDGDLELQDHFDINEYTDTHHAHAGVPHTLILSPGLTIEKGVRGLLVLGPPVQRPAPGRPRGPAPQDQAGLRPDYAAGVHGIGGGTGGAGAGVRAPGGCSLARRGRAAQTTVRVATGCRVTSRIGVPIPGDRSLLRRRERSGI